MLGVLAVCLGAVACADPSMPKADIENQAKQSVTEQLKAEVTQVNCEGDLKAVVDEYLRCDLLLVDGRKYGLTATVTAVQEGKADIFYQVDNTPMNPSSSSTAPGS